MHDAGPAPTGRLFHGVAGEFVPIPIAVSVGSFGIGHPNYLRRELNQGAVASFTRKRIQLLGLGDHEPVSGPRGYHSQLAAELGNFPLQRRDQLRLALGFPYGIDWTGHGNSRLNSSQYDTGNQVFPGVFTLKADTLVTRFPESRERILTQRSSSSRKLGC